MGRVSSGLTGLAFACCAVMSVDVAAAQSAPEHTARVEGTVAVAVTSPQSSRFDTGGGVAAAYELRPLAFLGIEARFTAAWLPSSASAPTRDGYGSYYAPSIGLRGYPLAPLDLGDLWLGVGVPLVITGDVVRPGIEVGLGYEFSIASVLRLGPVVRYQHAFQTDHALPNASDGGFVSFGISLAYPGASSAPRDSDGDGLLDPDDRCPREAEDVDRFEDENGCPDPDNDADGVLDGADACPLEPEDADGFEDANGCPDPDDDQDGVLDGSDGCPREAEDRDGFEDENGCPDPDNDADGIADGGDACPTQPETRNGHEDDDGCPDEAPPPPPTATEIELERLATLVLFPRNRAQVLGTSRPAIREVIRLLQEHPEITLLRIEAHASREGTTERNLELSQLRADTVIRLLVEGGIDRSRLVAQAYGDQQPEHHGDTEEIHARNRRVVFVVVRGGAAATQAQ